ncbi:hypothetical protein GC425_08010 [Corynebacterium sp. zg254]|uniref:DUF6779 domain-containing protein n=1 Tax=Corynebacterium zhongnanshanii TaxID=2768834 RepID=A0ABQ6VHY7_9CORY|nr:MULTISPECIES: DUF6779 domain-containing protein [Corynebacterium]KAB3519856.1 hypothetical protein F8377_08050 [Corynebacterium zhongnanshanii]MCR5914792.1 hypothetical protein [Corynebacterium sp. zg254]
MSKFLVFGLVVLALIASLLMLYFDSEVWLKIAVITALWAGFLGAVLATRYASQLDSIEDDARLRDIAHRAELDREKAEHREREAKLAEEYKQRESRTRDEHIEALRSELVQMRIQLAKMSGREFPEDEQAAVQAHAERIRELDSAAASEVLNPTRNAANRDRANVAAPSPAAPKAEPRKPGSGSSSFSTGSFAAISWTGQDAEETAQIPLVVDTSSMDSAAHTAAHTPSHAASHSAEHAAEHAAQPDSTESGSAQPSHHRHRAPETPEAQPTGGRRRADDSERSLTVAELMSRFKK